MEETPVSSQPWTMLLDPEAARSAVERLSKLNLRRRICRPLDRKRQRGVNAELMQFDAAIEDEPMQEDDLPEADTGVSAPTSM